MELPTEIQEAIDKVRTYLVVLKPEQRLLVMSTLIKGYCDECGDRAIRCYCFNDE